MIGNDLPLLQFNASTAGIAHILRQAGMDYTITEWREWSDRSYFLKVTLFAGYERLIDQTFTAPVRENVLQDAHDWLAAQAEAVHSWQ